MITIKEAEEIANKKLKEMQNKANIEFAIMKDETISFEYGWMFFYQSAEFVNTGNEKFLVGGNAPMIVDKLNSSIHITGSRMDENFYIEKYCQYRQNIPLFYKEIV